MGISGLLPVLRSVIRSKHLRDYRGKTVAVDAYSWIHKGIYGSAIDIYLKKKSRKYIAYCMSRIKLMTAVGVRPILVFDGGHLPVKRSKEDERRAKREYSRKIVEDALRKGDKSLANMHANSALDVTPELAYELITELKENNIEYIVAPYEADAQMTYLNINGMVDAVMTEDSDLIAFGAITMLFKLQNDGSLEELRAKDIFMTKSIDISSFTFIQFLQMCILSGCDYLPSLPNMGLKTAHKHMSLHRNIDSVIEEIRKNRKHEIPPDYREDFRRAELSFIFQRVYDPVSEEVVFLRQITPNLLSGNMNLDFLGPKVEKDRAKKIATGEICPITFLPFSTMQHHETIKTDDNPPLSHSSCSEASNKENINKNTQDIINNPNCLHESLDSKNEFHRTNMEVLLGTTDDKIQRRNLKRKSMFPHCDFLIP